MRINVPLHILVHPVVRAIICLGLCHLYLSASSQVTFRNTDTIYIQDGTSVPIPSKPYPSEIWVEKQKGWVSKVQVTLNDIHHNFTDGIDLLLVAPDQSNVILLSDVGGAQDLYGVTVTLDDDAANYLPDRTAFASGTYKPTNMGNDIDLWPPSAPQLSESDVLSSFRGIDPNGSWRLYAVSDMDGTFGVIAGGWALTLKMEKTIPQSRISYFTAGYNPSIDGVQLVWRTSGEFNTSKFVIERSNDNGSWTKVGELASVGFSSSNNSYEYTDLSVEEGTYTYRVTMVMKDGFEGDSQRRRVEVEEVSYSIYPNPARSFTYVVSDSRTTEQVTITLRDMYNKIILIKTASLGRTSPVRLDFNAEYTGPHYLEITSGAKTTAKVIYIIR